MTGMNAWNKDSQLVFPTNDSSHIILPCTPMNLSERTLKPRNIPILESNIKLHTRICHVPVSNSNSPRIIACDCSISKVRNNWCFWGQN